jgi:hypothetical protein
LDDTVPSNSGAIDLDDMMMPGQMVSADAIIPGPVTAQGTNEQRDAQASVEHSDHVEQDHDSANNEQRMTTGEEIQTAVNTLANNMYNSLTSEATISNVAVMPFTTLDNRQTKLGVYLADKLYNSLFSLKREFSLVDRQHMQTAIDEIAIGPTDLDLEVDINTRLLKTQTSEVLSVSSTLLRKSETIERLMQGPISRDAALEEPALSERQDAAVKDLKYQSAVDMNFGQALDLNPIYKYVKKTYPIEDYDSFLLWRDLGNRKDVVYITNQGRVLICSENPLRSFADLDAFYEVITTVVLDYMAKVKGGITVAQVHNMWGSATFYAQDKLIYKRVIYVPGKGRYEFPWSIKIPDIEISAGRLTILAEHRNPVSGHEAHADYYWDNVKLGGGTSHQYTGGDITKHLVYGTHTFNISTRIGQVMNIVFGLETINGSSPEKLEVHTKGGQRLVDSTPCWNISELEVPN